MLWGLCYPLVISLSIVGYPLAAAIMQVLGGHERLGSIAFRGLVLGLAVVTLVASRYNPSSSPRQAFTILALLWLALLSRYVWDATFVPLPMDLPWKEYGLVIVGTVLLPMVSVAGTWDLRACECAARLIQGLGLLAAILIVISVMLAARDFLIAGRLGMEEINPISVGHLGATLAIVSILAPRRVSELRGVFNALMDSRITRWLGGLFGIALVIASASRGPALALTCVFVLYRLHRDIARLGSVGVLRAVVAIMATVALLVGVMIAITGGSGQIPIVTRVLRTSVDQAVSVRTDMMAGALRQFEDSPLTGSSFVELVQRFYPHNIMVEILMTNGVVGFVLLLWLLVLMVRAGLRLLQTPYAWLALLCAQYLVGSMTSGSLYFDASFWILAVVVLAVDWKLRKGSSLGVSGSVSPS